MVSTHRTGFACRTPWTLALFVLLLAVPATASAQVQEPTWSVVPSLGFGTYAEGGHWASAGAELALEVERGGAAWRWSGWGSVRGLGVGCSEACWDGGTAVAVGGARSLGGVWLGGGLGVTTQRFGDARLLPYGRVGVDRGAFRLDVRIELTRLTGADVYVPVLVGVPLPLGRR